MSRYKAAKILGTTGTRSKAVAALRLVVLFSHELVATVQSVVKGQAAITMGRTITSQEGNK